MAHNVGDPGHVEAHNADEAAIAALDSRADALEARPQVLVLGPVDPVPVGTPTGTVILRTA